MTEAERDTSKRAVRAREVEMIGSEERMVIAIALAVVSIKRARGGNHTQAVAEMQEAVGSRASRLVEAFNTLVDVLDGSEKHDVAMMSLTVEYMGAGVSDLGPVCSRVEEEMRIAFASTGVSLFDVVKSGEMDHQAKEKRKRALRVQAVVVYVFQNAFTLLEKRGGGGGGGGGGGESLLEHLTPLIEAIFNGIAAASSHSITTTVAPLPPSLPEKDRLQLLYTVTDAFLASFCHGSGSTRYSPMLQQAETVVLRKLAEIHDGLAGNLQMRVRQMALNIESAQVNRGQN